MEQKEHFCDRAMEYVLTRRIDELSQLTVEKVARTLDVSQSYLCRIFKVHRCFTLREYLLREKMIRAVSLMAERPGLTIRNLAELLGFMDTNYFSQIFKQHFGISPGRYRECHKNRSI